LVKRSCSRQARACYRDDEEHAEQAIAIAREGCDGDDNGRARGVARTTYARSNFIYACLIDVKEELAHDTGGIVVGS
jgi:hypothetical protein